MIPTYEGILHGDRIEWTDRGPPHLPEMGVKVHVTFIDAPSPLTPESGNQAVLAALQALADSGVAEKFGDPVEWQRDIRKDRPLFGREE